MPYVKIDAKVYGFNANQAEDKFAIDYADKFRTDDVANLLRAGLTSNHFEF